MWILTISFIKSGFVSELTAELIHRRHVTLNRSLHGMYLIYSYFEFLLCSVSNPSPYYLNCRMQVRFLTYLYDIYKSDNFSPSSFAAVWYLVLWSHAVHHAVSIIPFRATRRQGTVQERLLVQVDGRKWQLRDTTSMWFITLQMLSMWWYWAYLSRFTSESVVNVIRMVLLFGCFDWNQYILLILIACLLLQRIVKCDWRVPPGQTISDDCRDLLLGILETEPLKRLTLEQIIDHPWYQKDLPDKAKNPTYPARPEEHLQVP